MSKKKFSDFYFCGFQGIDNRWEGWWPNFGPNGSRWAWFLVLKPEKTFSGTVRKFKGSVLKIDGKLYSVEEVMKKPKRKSLPRSWFGGRSCAKVDKYGKRVGPSLHLALRELPSHSGPYFDVPSRPPTKKRLRKSRRSSHLLGL